MWAHSGKDILWGGSSFAGVQGTWDEKETWKKQKNSLNSHEILLGHEGTLSNILHEVEVTVGTRVHFGQSISVPLGVNLDFCYLRINTRFQLKEQYARISTMCSYNLYWRDCILNN